jgi:hypothetical protein
VGLPPEALPPLLIPPVGLPPVAEGKPPDEVIPPVDELTPPVAVPPVLTVPPDPVVPPVSVGSSGGSGVQLAQLKASPSQTILPAGPTGMLRCQNVLAMSAPTASFRAEDSAAKLCSNRPARRLGTPQ